MDGGLGDLSMVQKGVCGGGGVCPYLIGAPKCGGGLVRGLPTGGGGTVVLVLDHSFSFYRCGFHHTLVVKYDVIPWTGQFRGQRASDYLGPIHLLRPVHPKSRAVGPVVYAPSRSSVSFRPVCIPPCGGGQTRPHCNPPAPARGTLWASIARVGGRTQVKERSAHARPGMHMQQCSVVPIRFNQLHPIYIGSLFTAWRYLWLNYNHCNHLHLRGGGGGASLCVCDAQVFQSLFKLRGCVCVCVCVCALYFDEVDPCAALGWTPHSAQVC